MVFSIYIINLIGVFVNSDNENRHFFANVLKNARKKCIIETRGK